jgi:general secretion pathway protein E
MIQKLPYNFANAYHMVIQVDETGTHIFHLATHDLNALAEIRRLTNPPWHLHQISQQEFQTKLSNLYESALDVAGQMDDEIDLSKLASQLPTSEDLLENTDDAPIIRLINAMFTQAIKRHASDIHIETYETQVSVRFRIDGILHEVLELKRLIAPLVTSRVKVMAKLDIAEKRLPQDGRISLKIAQHFIDVRVSTLPSNHGERIVLRILDKQAASLDLNLLGMSEAHLTLIKQMINEPHGIILLTGPTGSGKTTSLYAMLTELNHVTQNILTIEDPIEYDLPGIGQTQVNTKVDMTFAKGLRAILRQDPDVVMIGEIRDLETAEIAIQSSLTGHLVLSTLHTNSALASLTRLRDMGVESFLLSTSLTGLIAQRLVRQLCPNCKVERTPSIEEAKLLNIKSKKVKIYQPGGCDLCNQSGYQGRAGIYEIIPIDEKLRSLIHKNAELNQIEESIRAYIPSIKEDGFKRVLAGETSLAEIMRVTTQL